MSRHDVPAVTLRGMCCFVFAVLSSTLGSTRRARDREINQPITRGGGGRGSSLINMTTATA